MAKDTTNQVHGIHMTFLRKYHDLQTNSSWYGRSLIWSINSNETGRINYDLLLDEDNPKIILDYKTRDRGAVEWTPMHYEVGLEYTRCYFGGKRWYFRCPLIRSGVPCQKRVRSLYSIGQYFGCRHCADLTYESCLASKGMRGFPWKILDNTWKADEIHKTLRITHYNGKPTKKYQKCLDLRSSDNLVLTAEKEMFNKL